MGEALSKMIALLVWISQVINLHMAARSAPWTAFS